MQRARKQQEAEHAMQQGDVEIDAVKKVAGPGLGRCQAHAGQEDDTQRHHQGDKHQSDGRRQAHITVIDIAEYRR